jgi:hypothetical protein
MGVLAPLSAHARLATQPPSSLANFEKFLIKKMSPQILFFCYLQPNANIWNPTITPSGREVTGAERRKKKEKYCR